MVGTPISARRNRGPGFAAGINPTYSDATGTFSPEAMDACLNTAEERFRTNRRSTVARVRVAGHDLVIKRFNTRNATSWLKRQFPPTPARRSWQSALVLLGMGIATPTPVAYVERRFGPFRGVSYLVTEHLDGRELNEFLADATVSEGRKVEVTSELVTLISRLHFAGYVHGDLKARNVLIREDIPVIIDLDSLNRRWLAPRLRRGIRNDLARLSKTINANFRALVSGGEL